MANNRRDQAPRSCPKRGPSNKKKGLIIVYTGDGKGKSTAAFGAAFRALGHGMKVAVIQFLKGKWKTGEAEIAEKFSGEFSFYCFGDGFTWESKDFDQDVKTAEKAWEKCCQILHDDIHEVVVFDEINYAMHYHFLPVSKVVQALKKKPPMKHVILTGDKAPAEIIGIADLVTEMKCLKHHFRDGVSAQKGIEF